MPTNPPLTPEEKRAKHAQRMREARAAAGAVTGRVGRPPSEPCGTVAAYKRHLTARKRAREAGLPEPEICRPCKDAWNEHWNSNYSPSAKVQETA